ncbi:MAG: hypothetical protein AABZ39_13010 [Spirochaetota bacterium]
MFYLMLRMLADDLASRLLSHQQYEECVEKVTRMFCEDRDNVRGIDRRAPIL